jgi:hypothetical protein
LKLNRIILAALLGFGIYSANADTTNAEKLALKFTNIAHSINPQFAAPSVNEGKMFFNRPFKVKGKEVSCSSCHTTNPADSGKHIVTGKPIKPLSPSVNSERFTDIEKVEDKFVEHCNDILGADCTAEEKANFIAYLMTEKTPTKK